MDKYDEVSLIASLNDEICMLSHGPYDKLTRKATNCLICPIGHKHNDVEETIEKELCIPICDECASALSGNEWTLLFCLNCLNNVWVLRAVSKLDYFNKISGTPYKIIWMQNCPQCSRKLDGIWYG